MYALTTPIIIGFYVVHIIPSMMAAFAIHAAWLSGRRAMLWSVAGAGVLSMATFFLLLPSTFPVSTRLWATFQGVGVYFVVLLPVLAAMTKATRSAHQILTVALGFGTAIVSAFPFDSLCSFVSCEFI